MQAHACQACHMKANFILQNSLIASKETSLARDDNFASVRNAGAFPLRYPFPASVPHTWKELINSSHHSVQRNTNTLKHEDREGFFWMQHPNSILSTVLRGPLFGYWSIFTQDLFPPTHPIKPTHTLFSAQWWRDLTKSFLSPLRHMPPSIPQ